MKTRPLIATLAGVFCLASLAGAATLTNRYEFQDNLNASVGNVSGVSFGSGTLSYTAAAPTGAVGDGKSILLGQEAGTEASGFTLNNSVISHAEGSLSFWFNATRAAAGDGDDYILVLSNPFSATSNSGFAVYIPNNSSNMSAALGATYANNTAVAQDTWVHVALTWDGNATDTNGSWKLYINNVLRSTRSYALDGLTSTSDIRFGNWNGSSLTNQFSGHLYDIQFYNGALDADAVSYLYQNPGQAIIPESSTVGLLLGGMAGIAMLTRSLATRRR